MDPERKLLDYGKGRRKTSAPRTPLFGDEAKPSAPFNDDAELAQRPDLPVPLLISDDNAKLLQFLASPHQRRNSSSTRSNDEANNVEHQTPPS
jgi:hypothetical protein